MKQLDRLTLATRFLLTLAIVFILLALLALYGYLTTNGWEAEAAPVPALATPYEPRLIALDREAVDNAYRAKVEQLIAVWLKDETGQPGRAIVGVNQARKAYAGAMGEIERRERLLK